MKIIACAIAKGGTGKTSLSVHLAHYLDSQGHKVLMVDCDTQGNATQVFMDDEPGSKGVSHLFKKNGRSPDIFESDGSGVLVLPADEGLAEIDGYKHGEENNFRKNLRGVAKDLGVDYVVIDSPPSQNMGMLAPLVACDFAFSPFLPDRFCYAGIKSLIERIEQIRVDHNPDLHYLGLLINLYNPRNRDQTEIVETLEADLGKYLIPHRIGDRSAVARVAFTRLPVWAHKTGAAGVAAREMRGAMRWITEKMESQS